MSDNVKVCCRFRPFNDMEAAYGQESAIKMESESSVVVSSSKGIREKTRFVFDRVFAPESKQSQVYEFTAKPLAAEVVKGFNCTIFAYGQTGSGKTHTMVGQPETAEAGIIPRIAESLFDHIEEAGAEMEFTLKLSYVEIYMERIKDLLDPSRDNLKIRETEGRVWLDGAVEVYVDGPAAIMYWLAQGNNVRATATTEMNDESSRSHSVFLLTLSQRNTRTESRINSKLYLVDLAGSEAVSKSGASGNTLKEAQHINKSLSQLGNVISALTTNASHIPYRDSKLTRLLTDSLGGNSKTCLIVTASPSPYNAEETLSTLRFGTRAKFIKNKPTINMEKSVGEYRLLLENALKKCAEQEQLIEKLQAEIMRLKKKLKDGGLNPESEVIEDLGKDTESKGEGLLEERYQEALKTSMEMQGEIQYLSRSLQEKEEDVRAMEDELAAKDQELFKTLEELTSLQNRKPETAAPSNLEMDDLRRKITLLENENKRLLRNREMDLASARMAPDQPTSSKLEFSPELIAAMEQSPMSEEDKISMRRRLGLNNTSGPERGSDYMKSTFDILVSSLGRKCEEHSKLQGSYSLLEERAKATEQQLQKILESARFWHERAQQLSLASHMPLVLPGTPAAVSLPPDLTVRPTILLTVPQHEVKHALPPSPTKPVSTVLDAKMRHRSVSTAVGAKVLMPVILSGGKRPESVRFS